MNSLLLLCIIYTSLFLCFKLAKPLYGLKPLYCLFPLPGIISEILLWLIPFFSSSGQTLHI